MKKIREAFEIADAYAGTPQSEHGLIRLYGKVREKLQRPAHKPASGKSCRATLTLSFATLPRMLDIPSEELGEGVKPFTVNGMSKVGRPSAHPKSKRVDSGHSPQSHFHIEVKLKRPFIVLISSHASAFLKDPSFGARHPILRKFQHVKKRFLAVRSPEIHSPFWVSHTWQDARGEEETKRQWADPSQKHDRHDHSAAEIIQFTGTGV